MPLTRTDTIDEATRLVADAVGAVVVVPVFNAPDDVLRCFDALFTHTPVSATVLLVDDVGVERAAIDTVIAAAERTDHAVVVFHRPENGGFVEGCNDAFTIAGQHDVILVNSDVVVGPEWYERMSAAATSSNTVATVSTLTNFGTILSVPERNTPRTSLPAGLTPDAAAKAIAQASLQLLPTLPTGVGHCLYIRRAALNVVGGFDRAFHKGYGEEVDFSQRAIAHGFHHVCADDVFVYHRGNASFGEAASAAQLTNERLVNARYPWYARAVDRAINNDHSPLAHAVGVARRALLGYRVGIDGRALGMNWAGTQVVAYNTIVELCRRLGDDRVVVYVSSGLAASIVRMLEDAGAVVELVDDPTIHDGTVVDVIYRPYQVGSLGELEFLHRHGERVVVSQLDIIAFSNPAYFGNDHQWIDYRELTRAVLGSVDGVTFISNHVLDAVRREDLLPMATPAAVTFCGTDSFLPDRGGTPIESLDTDDRPIIVCLGNAYNHKNRPFVLDLLGSLAERGLPCRAVLAGAVPPYGSSLGAEAARYLAEPALRSMVTELGEISEEQKLWLYSKASLVLYPTISEGFGLVPFEAARRGVPTLCTRQGSLDEVLPDGLPTIDDLDLHSATELAYSLISDRSVRDAVVAELAARGETFTWARAVDELLEHFDVVLRQPRNRTRAVAGELDEPARIGGGGPSRIRARRRQLDQQILRLQRMTGARRLLAPQGSRRQAALRSAVNWARLRAQVSDGRQ